ncbi:MAG: carbohydrate-binding protein [Butyrivibrio sp.]|nr:carbohydrate-binding protein [Butyrivibrio sp.]
MKGRVSAVFSFIFFLVMFSVQSMSLKAEESECYTGPKLNPYCELQAELNFLNTGYEMEEDDGRQVVCLEEGEFFRVKDVYFDRGLNEVAIKVKADEPAAVEVRKDSEDGTVLGTIMVNSTKGEYEVYSTDASEIMGKNVIYFVCTYGKCSIDYWKAGTDRTSADLNVINPYEIVEAESMENAGHYYEGDIEYAVLGGKRYLIAKNVDFSKGVTGFEVVTQTRFPGAEMYICLDDPDSAPIARILTRAYSFNSCIGVVSSNAHGVHDVYITSNYPIDFDSWKALPGHLLY